MTNIKVGDELKFKDNNGDTAKVLGILGDLYFLSYSYKQTRGDMFYTLEGLKEVFEIKEEEWRPAKVCGFIIS